ncbi:MAG: GNAT family N-acetyltransferase [Clostridiales bacterium]|jgi:RimJ/RimL family protein N-acetyltransferase|nr:GNAT family N-acetyltransferase [Clostridiales bacterium]
MYLDILPIQLEDISAILNWNADTNADFLLQWAGRGYLFPLDFNQIAHRINSDKYSSVFKIVLTDGGHETMIGTVELNHTRRSRRSAMVCRYLIAPNFQGMGYGTLALMLLVKKAFIEWGYKTLRLRVFEYNTPAVHCYEKVGFYMKSKSVWDNGQTVLEMQIKNPRPHRSEHYE